MEPQNLWSVRIAVFTGIVFALSYFFPWIVSEFVLISSEVFVRPWIAITHIFLHGNLMHFGSNMFSLLLFGSILENYIGSKKFLKVFFGAGIFSTVGDIIFYDATLGASGAVFGILGALAVLRPKLTVWVMGVPMPFYVAAFLWAIMDITGMLYPGNVAHAAHLFGLAFGLVSGFLMRKKYGEPKRQNQVVVEEKYIDEWEEKNFTLS